MSSYPYFAPFLYLLSHLYSLRGFQSVDTGFPENTIPAMAISVPAADWTEAPERV